MPRLTPGRQRPGGSARGHLRVVQDVVPSAAMVMKMASLSGGAQLGGIARNMGVVSIPSQRFGPPTLGLDQIEDRLPVSADVASMRPSGSIRSSSKIIPNRCHSYRVVTRSVLSRRTPARTPFAQPAGPNTTTWPVQR